MSLGDKGVGFRVQADGLWGLQFRPLGVIACCLMVTLVLYLLV